MRSTLPSPSFSPIRPHLAIPAAVLALLAGIFSADATFAVCTSTLAVSTATFTCDNTDETITFSEAGGVLVHNRFGIDGGFASNDDMDSAVAGVQTLGATSGNSVILATGGGNDTVNIGTASSAASDLNVSISITNTGSNGDTVVIDDSNSGVGRTVTITSTQVTGLGTTVVSLLGAAYDGGVTLKTGAGSDTVNMTGAKASPSVQPTTVLLTNGDTFNIAPTGGSLNAFAQTITATAASATGANITINDSADPSNNTYSYSGSQVTRSLSPAGLFTLNYSNVHAPSLTAGTGNDTINITGALGGGSPTINGGGGNDTINLAPAIGTLDGFAASFNFVGGACTADAVILDDSLDTDPNTYTIFNSSISRPGFTGAGFDATVESVTLLGGTNANDFNLSATAPVTKVNVTGGGGSDALVFANGGTLGGGAFDGGGAANVLDYTAYTTAVTVNLGTNTATGTGGVTNVVDIIGGSGNDSLTGNGAINTIDGGPGNDTITGGPGNDVLDGGADDDIFLWNDGDGNDTITGGVGTDSVQVTGSTVVGDNFTVTAGGSGMLVSRSNLTPFTLDLATVERLTVNGSNGDDSFTLLGTTAGFATTFNGNDGDDRFLLDSNGSANGGTVKTILGPVTISGGIGSNQLTINDTGTTTNTVVTVSPDHVGAASGDNLFPAGASLTYQGIPLLFLTTGSGDDTVTAIPSATTIYSFIGGAQPTKDTVDVDLTGVTSSVLSGDSSSGQITSANRQPVGFLQFENLLINGGDPQGAFSFSSATFSANETDGSANVTVIRTGLQLGSASVVASTSAGTATPGSDYTETSTELIFAANENSKTFRIPLLSDVLAEGAETVNIQLSSPRGATLGARPTAVLTISDAGLPVVSINDVSVTEGNSGTTTARFTLSLSKPSREEVTVLARLESGSATVGADLNGFPAGITNVVFAPGATTQTLDVAVIGDTQFEPNETFFAVIVLTTPNVTLGRDRGVGTIIDDDSRFTITVTQPKLTIEPPPGFPPIGPGLGLLFGTFDIGKAVFIAGEDRNVTPAVIKYLLEVSPGRFVPVLADQNPGNDIVFAQLSPESPAAGGMLSQLSLGPVVPLGALVPADDRLFAELSPAPPASVTGSTTFQPGETTKTVFFTLPADFTGTVTVTIIAINDVAVASSEAPTASVVVHDPNNSGKEDKAEEKPKETEEQRQQRERTNAGNRSDVSIEGNVIAVEKATDGKSLLGTIMMTRNETVVVQVPCFGDGTCYDLQVGDYLEVDGYQNGVGDPNSYFVASDDVEITRNGKRVK